MINKPEDTRTDWEKQESARQKKGVMQLLSLVMFFSGLTSLAAIFAMPQYQGDALHLDWVFIPAAICLSATLLFRFLHSKGWGYDAI